MGEGEKLMLNDIVNATAKEISIRLLELTLNEYNEQLDAYRQVYSEELEHAEALNHTTFEREAELLRKIEASRQLRDSTSKKLARLIDEEEEED